MKYKYWNWFCDLKTPNKHKSGPDGSTGECYQAFREKLTTILLKLFQKFPEEGIPPNWFCEATITLIPKAKVQEKGKSQANVTDEHRCKNLQHNTSKPDPTIH